MRIDRVTARWVIVLLVIAGFAWVEASLQGSHYYGLTYGACPIFSKNTYCREWFTVGVFRSILVAAVGLAAFLFNERRSVDP